MNIEKIKKKLRTELDEKRFIHTEGVAYTAAAMAMCYGLDVRQAFLAGLLHDCAKCIPESKMIELCDLNGIEISACEKENPFLLHAKLGAFFAEKEYEIVDKEILSAITFHTTGKADMTILEKIIFTADYIEPNRKPLPRIEYIRELSFNDLDKAIVLISENTLDHLRSNNSPIDNTTVETYEYYLDKTNSRQ